jgi:NADH dehydrogenase [ubiquinone] 1 alpha subcomplex assembly factor 1
MHRQLLPLLLATACAMPAQDSGLAPAFRALADFAEGAEGARWRTVLDGVMGGRSTGSFVIEAGRMVFTGVLNTNGGGFSSVRRPGKDLRLGQAGEQGIHLRVRGDGRKYTLRLRQPSGKRRFAASYRAQFRTEKGEGWQDVFVPYSRLQPTWRGRKLDLPAIDPAKVDEIGISIDDKIDGPFRIEIAKIATYAEFGWGSFRSGRRPLVVFAADANDARLKRQLEVARVAQGGFEDREISVVVVLGEGESSAGARPLTAADAASLRARYLRDAAASKDGFAVLLIGKDGGVKRASAEPLSASALFAQIDEMPMRIREVSGRRGS